MPLLRKQPFYTLKPPKGIHPDEEVFHCKMTNEIFRTYEEFFERTILCNSLVWSCSITRRSGLTYEEALASERRAEKQLAIFPEPLQKPLLFLATHTHRTRLTDLNDDVFSFAKERYFIGETVDVLMSGEKIPSTVIKIVAPAKTLPSKSNGDVIVIDEESDPEEEEQRDPPPAAEMMYVVQPSVGKNKRVMVKAAQLSRKKGLYTEDKSKLFFKYRCNVVNGVWRVKESVIQKMKLKEAKYEDFFTGPCPKFIVSEVKKQSVQRSPAMSSMAGPLDLSCKRSRETVPAKSKKHTSEGDRTSVGRSSPAKEPPKPQPSETPEERAAAREKERLAKLAKQEEIRRQIEEEKKRRKEEKQKERLKKREEKKRKMEELKEWSRPRDDLECDDHKPMPELKELHTRLHTHLFGDALMVLEYINSFSTVFDFKQFFPRGFTWCQMECALLENDPQGPLCDLLQMFLCALFNLQEEEAEELQAQMTEEISEELDKKAILSHAGDEEHPDEDDQVSNNELIRSATVFAQFSQLTFGMPLRDTLLDQFTLTEVLRLHLMSSGAHATQSNARFRYQQRGGYSALDDPGLELRKQEYGLMKKMQYGNVFDLSPDEKLRLLTTLVQQIMTYATVRDVVDESYEKLRLKKYDLKLLQLAETKRLREVQAMSYRREMEKKVREQENRLKQMARAAQTKQAQDQGLEPPTFPPLEPIETPEQKQQWEEQEQENEQKKAEFAKKELELLQEIMELQQTSALCPLGRDRLHRRYWLFSSLPALLVEDHELFVSVSDVAGQASHTADEGTASVSGCEQQAGILDSSSVKDNGTVGKTSSPVNGDSSSHRLDVSGSNADNAKQTDETCRTASEIKDKVVPMETDPVKVEPKDNSGSALHIETKMEVASNKTENLSSEDRDMAENDSMKMEDSVPSSAAELTSPSPQSERTEPDGINTDQCPTVKTDLAKTDSVKSDCFLPGVNKGKEDSTLLNQSAIPKWYVIDSKECLQQLMESLNMRGFRESALQATLQDLRGVLDVTVESCPLQMLCSSPENTEEPTAKGRNQSSASTTRPSWGTTHSDSASELMELTLRDGLLDLEDRIYVGCLGAMKVKDRAAWRAALEDGGYSPLTDQVPFAQVHHPKKMRLGKKTNGNMSIPEELVARDLSHALVQIARGVELRFLKCPFGDMDERKKGSKDDKQDGQHKDGSRRPTYDRWEDSALSGTSLSQVFMHLAALDKSIKWDRSTLKTRCRLCRRRRDADKMLLCDKCDRGHHMYCLKPPITKIPSGDWFCPNCRPKQSAPRAQKKKRRAFTDVEEEEELVETPNLESSIEDREEGAEDEATEEDNTEEEEIVNEEFCTECQEGGILILCDLCPRSYHLQCTQPPLQKIPKGKWKCHVCVAAAPAGKSKTSKSEHSSKKGTPKTPSNSSKSSRPSTSGSQQTTPRNSPTPTTARNGKASNAGSREVTPKTHNQKGKVTPKVQGQRSKESTPSKDEGDSTPKSQSNARPKRKSSSIPQQTSHPTEDAESTGQLSGSRKRGSSLLTQRMQAAEDLLQELTDHDEAWPFLKPVDKKEVPDYYDVIQSPMDLSTIRNKVHQLSYLSPSQLIDDIYLVFTNCVEYNARSTPEYRAGQTLSKFFQSRLHELGLEDSNGLKSTPPAKKLRRC